MPEPVTVWLVRPGETRARRGSLTLDEARLSFATDEGEQAWFAVREISAVRRLRATPVLELRYRREDEDRRALFYFVEPPELEGPSASRLGSIGGRGLGRIAAMRVLRAGNRRLRPLIEAWEGAIRGALERERLG